MKFYLFLIETKKVSIIQVKLFNFVIENFLFAGEYPGGHPIYLP